jgi:hypothetical protein
MCIRDSDSINGLSRSVTAMMKHMATGDADPETLQQELTTIQEETATTAGDRQWDSTYSQASTMLADAVTEGDKRVLDPSGPELKETREAWNKAREEKSAEGLFRAVAMANRARAKFEREARNTTAEKPDPKDSLEMGTTKAGGGAPAELSNEDLWRSYGRGEVEMDDKVRAAGRALGRL